MNKLYRALFALLLAGYVPLAAAQPAPQPPRPEPQLAQIAHPALWKVVAPNATIYLFGTIHLLPANVHWFDGTVARAFDRSDTLVTEILDPTPAEMAPLVAAKAMLPAGTSLRDMLTPDQRARFEAALTANHVPVAGFDRFQPWYAAVALAAVPMMQMGYDPANGVDVWLGHRAQATARAHEAVETAAYQLGLFAGLPQPVQKAYLMEVVTQLPEVRTQLTGMIAAWEVGHAGELAKLMNADEDDPRLMQLLLIDRNKNWAKWIKARLAKPAKPHETLFIAVGAGHLAGPGSLLDQLRALGIASHRVQ
ncbi:MAG: TraB/GumN family protein [Pseudomonadota bacterium]|nr:TraB/GumN family protein [Pseudomonadota bacterium]